MFKPFTASLLLLAFVAQTFTAPFVMLDYFVNTAAYAKNCVNKAKPKMHCNGQCQMMKKIQEQEKKDQQDSENRAGAKMQQVLSSKSSFCKIEPSKIVYLKAISFEEKYPLTDMSYAFFHPPQA